MVARITPNQATASVQSVRPRLSVSVVSAGVSASAVVAASSIAYIELSISSILDTSGRYRCITEAYAVVDSAVLAVTKVRQDSFEQSDATVLSTDKALADTPIAADLLSRSVSKSTSDAAQAQDSFGRQVSYVRAASDATSTTDASFRGFGKRPSDTVPTQDILVRQVNFVRSYQDGAPVIDSSTLVDGLQYGFDKRSIDQAPVQDRYASSLNKPLSDQYITIDTPSKGVSKISADTLSAADAFAKQTQFSRGFSEQFGQTDFSNKSINLVQPVGDQRYAVPGYFVEGYVAADSVFSSESARFFVHSYVSGDYFAQEYVGSVYGPF